MAVIGYMLVVVGMLGGALLVVFLIAADKKRFLAGFDLELWRANHYLQVLPNFLEALHSRGFRTPWPAKCNAVSSVWFRLRMWPVLSECPSLGRRHFLRYHVALFALLEKHRAFIDDYVLQEKQRIVSAHLIEMRDTFDRDRLAQYLDDLRAARAGFARSLTIYDRGTLAVIVQRRFIARLRAAHVIFNEHGYWLIPAFETLRRWENSTGVDIAQEIPRETERRAKRRAAKLYPFSTL